MLVGIAVWQAAPADPEESAAAQTSAVAAPAAATAPETGKEVYNEICIACHVPPGIGGAPALGDADAWAPRIAQGKDTLIDHALNGYSGRTGIMPRKGGRTDLSDEEIIAAIEYMIAQVAQ
jgi:cytochrome c5